MANNFIYIQRDYLKMSFKSILSFLFIVIAVSLLVFYWFVPFETIEFIRAPNHANFSIMPDSKSESMQFYKNMRYPLSNISYKIYSCSLQKKEDMKRAFQILSNLTVLNFYPVNFNEEISVKCQSKNKIEEGMFIAGEGGPTNITATQNFNVILHGKVLLIKDVRCSRPNVALHELLHALGFDHSPNPNNIMYNISRCKQTIGDDIIELINKLYSYPSYPDLAFENISVIMRGRYADINVSIRNHGLAKSEKSEIIIMVDSKIVKKIKVEPLEIGYGRAIMLRNLFIPKISINNLTFIIDSSFEELNKENNQETLKIK